MPLSNAVENALRSVLSRPPPWEGWSRVFVDGRHPRPFQRTRERAEGLAAAEWMAMPALRTSKEAFLAELAVRFDDLQAAARTQLDEST